MARVRKSELAFDAIILEGSLISPAKLAEVADRKASEQADTDYHIPKGLTLRDETARYFRIGQALFRELFAGSHPSQQAAVRFTQELLRDVFGFTDIVPVTGPKVNGDRTYIVSLEALNGRVPVVVVPPSDDLDHASSHLSHDRRRSAATSLQDWLNAEDSALWGLCCNGEHLRLLRDNESLTRPAYIEANLRQIFESEDFAGFAVLWLIIHASRFGRHGSPATDCALERWRESGSKEGLAARERLSVGVKEALLALGNGFVSHPANSELRDRLTGGQLPLPDFFNELLRLVYRLIFVLAAEDRGLLHPPNAPDAACKLYADGYSLGALRDRAIRRSGWNQFHDRWQGLLIVFRALAHGEPRLGLPALGGLFEPHATPTLDQARLSNRALMDAIFRLAWLREDSSIVPVNWRDMETEELGSVYEGLLELTPRLTQDGRGFAFAEGLETKGNERKKTGSYYTPDSLVQALLDSALDPVLDRVESEAQDAPAALLGVTVIDPACGSGHFLLAAARRIATRVARLRTGGVPSAADYRHALRDAVRNCIHGVDRNSMAIELARVALWIETVEPGKPLGFLDANLCVGDSLLGIFDLKALEKGIPDAAYKPLTGDDRGTANDFLKRNRSDKGVSQDIFDFSGGGTSVRKVTLPDLATSLRAVRQLPEDTLEQIDAKLTRYQAARGEARLTALEQAADLYIAAFLTSKTKGASLDLHTSFVPTTEDMWKAMRGSTVYGPRLGAARKLASDARAFHWPIEFPDVMSAGGFDVVLGNPPWERIKIQEQEFFASREPEIADAPNAAARGRMIERLKQATAGTRERLLYEEFELTKRIAEASSEFARTKGEDGGRFPLTGRGDVNTYTLFAELFARLTRECGRSGVIVPTGIATDATTAAFFGALVLEDRLVELIDFENRGGLFPAIDSRMKFCLFVTGKGAERAEFSFFLTDASQLADSRRRFSLAPAQIAAINPNTKTAPVFRSRYDADLAARIYERIPVLITSEDRERGNQWQLSFHSRIWHMAEDSEWFRTAQQLLEAGYLRQGSEWAVPKDRVAPVHVVPSEDSSHRDSSSAALSPRYVPLYEAKMIHHFDHRWATYDGIESRDCTAEEKETPTFEVTPRYWVPGDEVRRRLDAQRWTHDWLIGWRDITNATNERTVIFGLIPLVAVGHTAPLMFVGLPAIQAAALVCNLNSLVVDYVARTKLGGTHLSYGYLTQLPVLPPGSYNRADLDFLKDRLLRLAYTSSSMSAFASDLGHNGPPFPWDENGRARLRAELDAWYVRKYGLTRDELCYILDPADVMDPDYPSETFRVLKSNEIRKFGNYRTRDLVLEAWSRMEAGDLPAPAPYDRNATELQTATAGVNPLFGAGPLFETPEVAPNIPSTRTAPSALPDNAWAMPAYDSISVQLLLAAILKKLSGPTPAERVRLAALYALRPDHLASQLSGTKRSEWQRLVGRSGHTSQDANVIRFVPRVNVEWRDAYTQLRGMRALIEAPNDMWAPGSSVQQFTTEGWPDGRAEFVLNVLEGIGVKKAISALPADDQAWVKGYAA
jgi:hypothetical protein